jgi:hypothetical protein
MKFSKSPGPVAIFVCRAAGPQEDGSGAMAIGRSLNQIARAANQGERVDDRGPHDVQLMLRVCGPRGIM